MRTLAILLWLVLASATQAQPDFDAGQKLFQTHCTVCHGPRGDGGKGTNLAQPRLPRAVDDAALASIIIFGIPGTEMPQTRMTQQQLVNVMAFVRSLGAMPAEPVHGSAQRGEQIYRGKGNCAQCHAIQGRGGTLGPELTDIGMRRGRGYLRESLIDPEAAIPDNFTSYTKVTTLPANFLQVRVMTADGRRYTGARVNEDAFSIQIRDTAGHVESFFKEELRELHKDWGKSPMPSYRELLSAAELDDVVAYLASLRGDR